MTGVQTCALPIFLAAFRLADRSTCKCQVVSQTTPKDFSCAGTFATYIIYVDRALCVKKNTRDLYQTGGRREILLRADQTGIE